MGCLQCANAATRSISQNAATLPDGMGARQAQQGGEMATPAPAFVPRAMNSRTAAMNRSWPTSRRGGRTERHVGSRFGGRPTSLRTPAKPDPCSSPKVNATNHGQRSRQARRPWCECDFAGHENNAQGNVASTAPAALHKAQRGCGWGVRLCAIVNVVTVEATVGAPWTTISNADEREVVGAASNNARCRA